MLAESIKREASRLKAKYQTVDLHKICQRLKIRVQELPMGTSPKACKGFFLVNARCKVITINSDLPEEIRRIILLKVQILYGSSLQLLSSVTT